MQTVFTNPLMEAGADPWCIFKNGFYYYTHTTALDISIWKSTSIGGLKNAEKKLVFTPPKTGMYAKNIWAPELHYLRGKWYIYFAADCGNNSNHRMWVLQNSSKDPMQGEWVLKGKLTTPDDKWSIDASVFEFKKQLYITWSGWKGDFNGQQNIYIAKMKNPWTVTGDRICLSSPELAWELHGDLKDADNPTHVKVNEGPVVVKRKKTLHLFYSASGCWTDYYAVGMLTASTTSNPMDATAWKKNGEPLFKKSAKNRVYAPGHNSFFKSPDGREDWILYHANNKPGLACNGQRSPRAQKFTWGKDGLPNFGLPVKEGELLKVPSGEIDSKQLKVPRRRKVSSIRYTSLQHRS